MNVVRTWRAFLFFAILLAAEAPLLRAQYQAFEGLPVASIRFDPATQPLTPEELARTIPLKPGQPLNIGDVRASIERLFATGRYSDIEVDAERESDGVTLRFLTKNSWFIGSVSIEGDVPGPPNSGQLENAARLDLGQPFSDRRVSQAVANQERLLEANGLYSSRITPLFGEVREFQQMNMRFRIEPGPRARFGEPRFVGELKMKPERITDATGFRRWLIGKWKPVTQMRVRQGLEGVRKLYRRDNRLEAKVSLDSMDYDAESNSASPVLRIDAGPRINVRTFGAKLSNKLLERYVPVFEERAVDRDLLSEGVRNLQNYFQSEGYFDADVQYKEQRVTNDQANLDFLIYTGRRHRLVEIVIEGNHYFNAAAIRERMYLQPASFLQFRHGRYSASLLSRDEDTIVNLYQSNGFRDVKVTHRVEDDFRGKTGDIAVFIEITEGPQLFVGKLEIEGVKQLDRATLEAMLSSAPGQPFSEFNVAVDRNTILAQYFEGGFPNATFEWNSRPGAQTNQVDLRFRIDEGPEQFVRQVVTSGLHTTKPALVDSRLTLKPGDALSVNRISEIQRSLYDLGVFSRVDAAIQDPDGQLDHKYVLINVDEARRYSMAVGFGAELGRIGGCETCFDAPAGATGFAPRVSLDLARNNLWGLAHSLSLRTRFSTLDQRALLNYSWPRFRNLDNLTFSFTGLFENSRDVRTFSFQRAEVSSQLMQRLSKSLTLLYRYTYRRVSVSDLKITPFLIPQLSAVRVGIPSFNLVQDRRDDPIDPHRGIYNTVDLGLAHSTFGSQVDFLRALIRNSTYHPLGKRLVLARSTEFGNIKAFNHPGDTNLEAIPLPERFFGGGGNSNRGFPEEQAGPRDPSTGFPLGGSALLFNQTELRFPLLGENVGGVLFHDMGNVYSSADNISFRTSQRSLQDFDYMVHSVGFGVRYRTPVGPVRVDLGYSINPPYFYGFKGSQQDLVNAGVDPCAALVNKCVVQNVSHFQFFFSIGQTF